MTALATEPLRVDEPGGRFAGMRPLLAITLRQDVQRIAPWVLGISALSASSILAYHWVFPDPQDRIALATTLGANPALSLVFGPARDLTTADGFNAWRAGQLGAFFAALMAILIVIRNSRANEDSGQAELIASGVVARSSRLAVALTIAALSSVAVGVVCFLLTIACGGGLAPTLILSATFTAAGLMFTGLSAVTAQLGSDARTASGLAISVLGISYVLRGYLDSSTAADWVSWLTPLGWLEQTHPATDNNPWPLLLSLALALILIAVAFSLEGRRDFGQGMIPTRPGPAQARLAGNVWGLTFKLHRASLFSWLIAFLALGMLFGTLATSVGDIFTTNPAIAASITSGATDPADLTFAFLVTILQLIAIIASVLGVQIVMRLYTEETDLRAEPLLAGSLRRASYLGATVVLALLATAAAMTLAGTALGLVAHAQEPSLSALDIVKQALITTPAVWVLLGLAIAAVGAKPAVRVVGWLGIVATFGLTILGPTFKLSDWALDISPLRHIPNVTSPDPSWVGIAWLILIALVLIGLGFTGYRRRDIL